MSQRIFNAKFVAIALLIVVVSVAAIVDNNHIRGISFKMV